jgi:hypothetical protein
VQAAPGARGNAALSSVSVPVGVVLARSGGIAGLAAWSPGRSGLGARPASWFAWRWPAEGRLLAPAPVVWWARLRAAPVCVTGAGRSMINGGSICKGS